MNRAPTRAVDRYRSPRGDASKGAVGGPKVAPNGRPGVDSASGRTVVAAPRNGSRPTGRATGASRGSASPRPTASATRATSARAIRGLKDLRRTNPARARDVVLTGDVLTTVHAATLRAGLGLVGGVYSAPYYGYGGSYGFGSFYDCPYYSPFGFGFFGNRFSFAFNFGFRSPFFSPCYWYWWPTYTTCWAPIWYGSYYPYYAQRAYYTTVVYDTYQAPAGEVYQTVSNRRAVVPSSLSAAAERYLSLGDSAFREGRYTDAVQFYAKAVEFAPKEGALYLVLADALFASGDYHYGAYAIRKGLELDPALADASIDKREFYPNPADFEHQLAVLEQYVQDHPQDRDARLVLALNYLFGGAPPQTTVDFLESLGSGALRDEEVGQLLTASARRALANAK